MQAIVAADANWGIGRDGTLLVRIPADMKRFREMTTGKVVVLGRKTLQTFPQGRPLPDRDNIILSRNPDFRVKGAAVVHDLSELQKLLADVPQDDVFCIGGAQIYELLLPQCDVCHVTRLERSYHADAFFPDLDRDPAWELAEESEEQTCFDTVYTFCTYRRK
ncbi:MAG: dihydrofolate reductase [Lachnospiraceae bacterium]|nr:dihydrofolate reductase [Lachnospiraceae bacterium]